MTRKEIRKQLSELRKEMKAMGIRKISFMNGGLTPAEYHYNAKLFELKLNLEKAKD